MEATESEDKDAEVAIVEVVEVASTQEAGPAARDAGKPTETKPLLQAGMNRFFNKVTCEEAKEQRAKAFAALPKPVKPPVPVVPPLTVGGHRSRAASSTSSRKLNRKAQKRPAETEGRLVSVVCLSCLSHWSL